MVELWVCAVTGKINQMKRLKLPWQINIRDVMFGEYFRENLGQWFREHTIHWNAPTGLEEEPLPSSEFILIWHVELIIWFD